MSIDKDLLDRLMEGRSPGDLFGKTGILAELTKALAERALSTEMDVHLDEERGEEPPEGQNQPPNRRNGRSQKTVTTDSGKVVLNIPRDRNGTFDPMLIAKYQRRFPEFDRKIVSMYARGMTTREIQGHIEEIYGVEASPSLISAITDAVMEEVTAWQNRPLEPCYPIVFMDAIRVNIRSDGAVSNKAVFVVLAVLPDGTRDVLGLWFQANEGAKFWAKVLSDLRNRGVQDILIAVVDGLKGFPQAIEAAFPQTRVQTCWCGQPPNGTTMCHNEVIKDHMRETVHGKTYSSWDRHVKARLSASRREHRREAGAAQKVAANGYDDVLPENAADQRGARSLWGVPPLGAAADLLWP